MLVIASEINCLKTINNLGVYPDEFYTNIEAFKEKLILLNNADVVIILAGICSFNRKFVLDMIQNIRGRIENANDNGIRSLYVITDVSLPSVKDYYKYVYDISKLTHFSGWKTLKGGTDVWKKLSSEPKQSVLHLSDYDVGDTTQLKEQFKQKITEEDEIKKLIKIPSLEQLKS